MIGKILMNFLKLPDKIIRKHQGKESWEEIKELIFCRDLAKASLWLIRKISPIIPKKERMKFVTFAAHIRDALIPSLEIKILAITNNIQNKQENANEKVTIGRPKKAKTS